MSVRTGYRGGFVLALCKLPDYINTKEDARYIISRNYGILDFIEEAKIAVISGFLPKEFWERAEGEPLKYIPFEKVKRDAS